MTEETPFIPYANHDARPDQLKAPLEAYEARMGFMPNALKMYMHRPELLGVRVGVLEPQPLVGDEDHAPR